MPAALEEGNLRREDMVRRARPTAARREGDPPSLSEFPFHEAIYAAPGRSGRHRACHSVALVAFSLTGKVPETRLFHQAREVCGTGRLRPHALPGSKALAEHIVATFAEGFHCVILENHGVVVGGSTLQDAFERFETLEFTAKTILKATMLGKVRYLSDEQLALPGNFAATPTAFPATAASSAEKELRLQLCAFLHRGYRNRLMISTEGSFSARVDAQSFLITPYQLDRHTLEVGDLVLMRSRRMRRARSPAARPDCIRRFTTSTLRSAPW